MSNSPPNLVRTLIVLLIAGLGCGRANCAGPSKTGPRGAASYNRIPLSFEANQGQTDRSVQYVSHGRGYSLYLKPGAAFVTLERQATKLDASSMGGQGRSASSMD